MPAVVALVALVLQSAQSAQPAVAERGAGAPLASEVAWNQVERSCLTPEPPTGSARTQGSCRVVSVSPLGHASDSSWFSLRYRRLVVIADRAVTDSISYDELVLVGRRGADPGAALRWHVRRERDIERLDTLVWTPTPAGVFLEMHVCLVGTGGCSREYLHRSGNFWRAIEQPFAASLQRRLSSSHSLHKGQQLDLRTMEGIWPVAAEGDGNCCPTFEIPFRVELRGAALELLSAGAMRRR